MRIRALRGIRRMLTFVHPTRLPVKGPRTVAAAGDWSPRIKLIVLISSASLSWALVLLAAQAVLS